MVEYKKRERKSLGGFPARCAGCLLALIILFIPFTAFAFSTTDANSLDFTETVPSIETITRRANMDHKNVFVFWNPDDGVYYLATQKNFNEQYIYQSIYNSSNQNLYHATGPLDGNITADLTVYRYNPSIDNDWVEIPLTNNSINYSSYFSTLGCYLYAFYAYIPQIDNQSGAEIFTYTPNGSSNFAINPLTTKYYIDRNSFELSDMVQGEQGNESQGLFAKLKDWIITYIYTPISNLFNTLSSFVTNFSSEFSSFISNLGSTIWNAIKSPFQNATDNPPNGGLVYRLWVSLQNLPSAIWNAIKMPFEDDVANPPNGGLLWRMWQSIKAPFIEGGVVYNFVNNLIDDIKGLFIPSPAFLTTYKNNWTNMLSTKFGGAYQVLELSHDLLEELEPLFDFEEVTNFTVTFPELRFPVRPSSGRPYNIILISAHNINFDEVFTPQSFGGFNFWSFWQGFLYFTTSLSLLYFCKREFYRVVASFQGGSDV